MNNNFKTYCVDGQTIRTLVRPGKPHLTPLLIFNGIGAPIELVSPFVQALNPDLEVIAFDVPGVGGSSTPFLPYSFSGLARLVVKLLDRMGYDQVDAAGVSWGGFAAQQFAYDHPKRCNKLILAATHAGVACVPPSLKVLWLMASPARYTNSDHMTAIAADIYGGSFRDNPELSARHANKMQGRQSDWGYICQMWAVYWWTSIHWLHKITQPTLVLAGNDDPLIPLVNMRVLANRIPDSELHILDDGHLFLVTQAETVAPIVMRFLES